MCFNIVIYNPNGKNLKKIFRAINRYARINKDGFSIWTSDNIYVRTLDFNEFLLAQTMARKSEIIHTHFRLASQGAVNLENVHMWKVGNYYVSHNGYVGKYCLQWNLCTLDKYFPGVYYPIPTMPMVNDTKSDTYKLITDENFVKYVEQKSWEQLMQYLRSVNFYGVMFLTNENEMIGLSVNKGIHITFTKGILTFSNAPIRVTSFKRYGIGLKAERIIKNTILRFDFNDETLEVI